MTTATRPFGIALVAAAALACAQADLTADQDDHAGARIRLNATAYCQAGKTAAGTQTHTGIVAADPRVLPVGSVLRITAPDGAAGIYTVMDTGGRIKGRDLDIFMPSCTRAEQFGRRSVEARVLRRGWDPKATGRR